MMKGYFIRRMLSLHWKILISATYTYTNGINAGTSLCISIHTVQSITVNAHLYLTSNCWLIYSKNTSIIASSDTLNIYHVWQIHHCAVRKVCHVDMK